MWPMLTVFLVILITVRIAYLKSGGKEFVFYKEVLSLIFVIYILLFFELASSRIEGSNNLVPFTEIFKNSLSLNLFLENVLPYLLIFLPFGYFVAAFVKTKSSKGLKGIFLIGFITSLTIQLVGMALGYAFIVDMIILNVLGGISGFLIFIGLSAIKKHLPGLFQKNILYNILSLALIALVVLYFLGYFSIG